MYEKQNCYAFLVSVKVVINFYALGTVLKFSGKKQILPLHLVEMDKDPNSERQPQNADRAKYTYPTGSGSTTRVAI